MNVALVCPYDWCYPGGVTAHIAAISDEFHALGHRVTVIAPSSHPVAENSAVRFVRAGGSVGLPANGSIARITLSLRLSGQIKRLLRDEHFDVIHLHEPLLPALPLTVLRHSATVNIGTFHAYSGSHAAYRYTQPLLKRFADKLDARIAVSDLAHRFVAAHFGGSYQIIPNGIRRERFDATVEPWPELCDGRPNILFVGRLEPRKGLGYLLRACAELQRRRSRVRLIVVGPAAAQNRERYGAVVRRLNLRDVVFTGIVAPDALPRYYQSCDVFCAPSIGGESFGMILLEAMAAGKPIVASNIPGYRALVCPGEQGLLVPPSDVAALADALEGMLADAAARRRMGEAGRARAAEYAWPAIARRVLGVYEEAIKNTNREAL